MNTDPQLPMNADAPRPGGQGDGPCRAPGANPEASGPPAFPSGPLREWLNRRLTLSLPVWAIALASLALILVAID